MFTKAFSYRVGLNILIIALASSCHKNGDVITPVGYNTPTVGVSSQITNAMRKELPGSVLEKMIVAENARFMLINRSTFGINPSVEDVIKRVNQLNTATNHVGQTLSMKTGQPGAKDYSNGADDGNDPPSRSITYTTPTNAWNVFDGRITINYNLNSYGQPVDLSYNSFVTISAFGAQFGTYTQTNQLSSSYQMSDGSTVIVFQVQGTYNPPLTSLTGLSNSWEFTGYTIFPRLTGGGGGGGENIRGFCTMQVYENE